MFPRPVDTSWIANQPSSRSPSRISPTCSSPCAPRPQRSMSGVVCRSTASRPRISTTSTPTATQPRPSAATTTALTDNTATARIPRRAYRRWVARACCPATRAFNAGARSAFGCSGPCLPHPPCHLRGWRSTRRAVALWSTDPGGRMREVLDLLVVARLGQARGAPFSSVARVRSWRGLEKCLDCRLAAGEYLGGSVVQPCAITASTRTRSACPRRVSDRRGSS